MRGLRKLNNAANRLQAIQDYDRLISLATNYGLETHTLPLPEGIGWRKIDVIAKQAVVEIINEVGRLDKARHDLRDAVYAIYPGLK